VSESLKMLSSSVLAGLSQAIEINIERYTSEGFQDLSKSLGWAIETSYASWSPDISSQLDPSSSPEAEVNNSLLIYQGLKGMTAALAREERLWARLCHVECLEYARARWLKGTEKTKSQVRNHFFAEGLSGCRDDNAIGRLWWNGHVAHLASPDDVELGLRKLLARANYRLQIVDRADTAFRQPLISGIFRLIDTDSWLESDDKAIAYFMLEVNKHSGGVIFEALDSSSIDSHLRRCLDFAKERMSNKKNPL